MSLAARDPMVLLLDFLPLIGFLAAFGMAGQAPDAAAELLDQPGEGWLGAPPPALAPLLLACAAGLVLMLAQAAWRIGRGRPLDAMPAVNGLLMAVLGGASLWFSPEAFLRWQPSVLCWTLGLAVWLAQVLAGRNLLRSLLGGRPALPDRTWHRLNFAWVAFFAAMGLLHLWAAYSLGPPAWDDFRRFGAPALVALFALAQAALLGLRWLRPRMPTTPDPPR